jgi:hypothetical protein
MNWEAIGAIGEIIGAAAVVASLVYLAVQIQSQNRESRLSSMHDISVGYRDTLAGMAEGDMADIFAKALDRYESLTRPETIRLIAVASHLFRVWEEAYLLFQAGNLEKRTWETMLRQFSGYISVRPFYEVWAIRKQYFDSEFQDFVNGLDRVDYVFMLEDQRDA